MGHVKRKWEFLRVAVSGIHHWHNLMVSAGLERPSVFNENIRIRNQLALRSISNGSEIWYEDSRLIDLPEDGLEDWWIAWDSLGVFVQTQAIPQRFLDLCVLPKLLNGRFDGRLNQISAFSWAVIALPRKEDRMGHTFNVLDQFSFYRGEFFARKTCAMFSSATWQGIVSRQAFWTRPLPDKSGVSDLTATSAEQQHR
jgi:hypothetical protein